MDGDIGNYGVSRTASVLHLISRMRLALYLCAVETGGRRLPRLQAPSLTVAP